MAKDHVSSMAWLEAVGLPLLALAFGLGLEALFPRVEWPFLVFIGLIIVAIRHAGPPAWVGYGVAVASLILHNRFPISHPVLPGEAVAEVLILAAAGALVILGQRRARWNQRAAAEREYREAVRLRNLLASSPDGIWRIDGDGITLEVNERMAAMIGYAAAELVGKPFAPYITEASLPLANAAFEKSRRGEPDSFEMSLRRRDGTAAWTLCSTHPELDADGRFVGGFGILRDITARHRAEAELLQAMSLLEATIQSTADGLLVVDVSGRIVKFNDRFATMWRIPAEIMENGHDDQALAFAISQLEAPDPFLSRVRELYATPDAESVDTLRFKDGRVFERYSIPQRMDGAIVGRVWSFRDVTERNRAEQEQRLALERESAIARNLDAALFTFVLGPNGSVARYEYFSHGAEGLYGVPRAVLEHDVAFWLRRVHSEDVENVVRPAMARLERLLPAVIEVRYQSSKGIHRWHRSQLFPRAEANGEIHVDGIEADVTERVKLEEQLRHAQKMEAIGQLAGGVAHDFNNILTAVIGYSDLLLKRMAAGDPNRRAVEEIRRGGDRAAGLTRQLLAFGRRATTQPRLLDIDKAIRDLEPMLRRLVAEDVAIELDLRAASTVRIDPTQLEQVIVNLAVNARDALPAGGVVRIETDSVHRDAEAVGVAAPRSVRLRFSDTGTGISAEVLEHIFEPFFTTKDPGRGTGLGLAMVYGIVRQHHGSIDVRSELGRGTEFTLYLPESEGEDPALPSSTSRSVGGRERVLLVEDDPVLLVLGREILAELGYDAVTAGSGTEALEILAQSPSPFDLLVTDVVMPEMGGPQLAREAAARYPGLRVLFVSGYPGDARLAEEFDAPGSTLLEKPFTPLGLARRVREVLDTASRGRTRPTPTR
jgi:PAS domain S-box-containing protein